MSKRSVSVLLGLIVIVAVGTLVQDFRFDAVLVRERAAALAIDRDLGAIARSVTELRTAQAGYVGAGQAPAAWISRATDLVDQINRAIHARKSAAPSADARARYDAALGAVSALVTIDNSAKASVAMDDRLHAADLVFIDAAGSADTVLAELAAARVIEEQAASLRISRWATLRLAMNGLAVVLVAVIALYFGRALTILSESPTSTVQMIRELPPAVKPGSYTLAPPAAHAVPAAQARTVSLTAAAELCVDLARVLDGRDVPALLERTATLLDAKGVVIWAVDTGGALLRPSLGHGYSDKVMSRLRPLQVDGDNVTALAFRSLQAQAVPGPTSTDSGAIAVPLMTATGCVGVLAAEVRQSRPHPDLLPMARIVAAQFSTLVSPSDDGIQKTAQA